MWKKKLNGPIIKTCFVVRLGRGIREDYETISSPYGYYLLVVYPMNQWTIGIDGHATRHAQSNGNVT